MLVYDVNYLKSFDSLDNWHEEFLKQVLSLILSLLLQFWLLFNLMNISFLEVACYVTVSFGFGQASPRDPKAFPFILLGNKVDIDGGNSRVVS